MISLTATTESNPQVIAYWRSYYLPNVSSYWELRCVAWVSQDAFTLKSTVHYKWQVIQFNYFPYWLDSHVFTVSFGGQSDSVYFNFPRIESNGTRDMCSARTLGTFDHDPDDGSFEGTFRFEGARCRGYLGGGGYTYEAYFDYSEAGDLPIIHGQEIVPEPPDEDEDDPPVPTPEPTPPIPLEFDNDPRFYIYSDGELIYAAGVKGYEVIHPKLTLEVNKAGSLTFGVPIGSAAYNKISKLKSTIEVRQGNEILFRGRLLNTERGIQNTRSCYCEGFLAWLNDIAFLPYKFETGEARTLFKSFIRRYNLRSSDNRKITYKYSDISAKIAVDQTEHSNAWKEIKSTLLDNIGGYLVPYLTENETGIQWLSSYGTETSQVIQFGQNLLDFKEYIDASQVFTAVRPYGKEVEVEGVKKRVALPEMFVEDQTAINTFGRIERTIFFDEITSESALRKAAKEYLRTGIDSSVSITLKAIDMHLLDIDTERIRLGNSVRSISVPNVIDAYFLCTKMEIPLDKLSNSEYTFGVSRRTISAMTDSSYNKYVITEGDDYDDI